MRLANVGLYLENYLWIYTDKNFLHALMRQTHFWSFSTHLRYTVYCVKECKIINNEKFIRKEMKVVYRKSRLGVYIILTELAMIFPVTVVYSKFRENRSNYKKIGRVVNSLLLSNLKQTIWKYTFKYLHIFQLQISLLLFGESPILRIQKYRFFPMF